MSQSGKQSNRCAGIFLLQVLPLQRALTVLEVGFPRNCIAGHLEVLWAGSCTVRAPGRRAWKAGSEEKGRREDLASV